MHIRFLIAAAITLFGTAVAQAAPDTPTACGTRSDIISQLAKTYHETHRATGLGTDTKLVEIWASAETGSWTILVTEASGKSCIAAAGEHWLEEVPQAHSAGIPG